jgi:hypothetical protein
MATGKQRVIAKDKEVEKRLEAVRAVRQKLAQAHGTFPKINSLIREIREGIPYE